MFDTESINNLSGITGVNIPGFAIALGSRAEWQIGMKSGKLRCYIYALIDFNLAIGLPDPWLLYGMLRMEGGLVVKVFGFGFEFSIYANLQAVAPEPFHVWGEFGISIDLPWPLPDIDVTVPITIIPESGSLPAPGIAANALSIHPSNTNQPITFKPGEKAPVPVPIDCTMSLAFRFPIQNEVASLGSFNFDSVDGDTKYITAQDPNTSSEPKHGYSFRLSDLTLTNIATGKVLSKIPAFWTPQFASAPGEQKARVQLDLFCFDAIPTSRYLGTSATYIDSVTKDWTFCPPSNPTQMSICYDFSKQPLGTFTELTIMKKGHPNLKAKTKPRPGNSDFLIDTFHMAISQAHVVDIPWISRPQRRVVAIPLTYGEYAQAYPSSETLVLEFERAHDITMFCVRQSRHGAAVTARFYDHDRLVNTSEGVAGSVVDEMEELLFGYPGPATRIELSTTHVVVVPSDSDVSILARPEALLIELCLQYESGAIKNAQNAASSSAWSKLWSDLVALNAGASDALLLDPGCEYQLHGKLHWQHLTEAGGGDQEFTYTFNTEPKNREPSPLRKRNPQVPASDDHSEIDTLPSDVSYPMYTTRPIRLTFSTARVMMVFAKFEQQLALRLLDDHGVDLSNKLNILKMEAAMLPEYKKVWQSKIVSAPCTPSGVKSLWDVGMAVFDTLLDRNREYTASLHAVPLSLTDFTKVEWQSYKILHNFKFRTSRWKNLAEHVAAHGVREEIVEGIPDFTTLKPVIGTKPLIQDDQLLDKVLFDSIGLPFRKPAAVPEVVLVWCKAGAASYAAIGMLLDGPEPLVRGAGSGFSLKLDGSAIDFREISGKSHTRSLLLFTAGGTFTPLASGVLKLTISDIFSDSTGKPATETATIAVPVSSAPAILAEEFSP